MKNWKTPEYAIIADLQRELKTKIEVTAAVYIPCKYDINQPVDDAMLDIEEAINKQLDDKEL